MTITIFTRSAASSGTRCRTFSSIVPQLLPRRIEGRAPALKAAPQPPSKFGTFDLLLELKGATIPLSPRRPIPESITRPDYVLNGTGVPELSGSIDVKGAEDLRNMRNATNLAARALKAAGDMIKPGITTDEIDCVVYDTILDGEGYPSPLGYLGFPNSCCTSVNNVLVHGIPDQRRLRDGDIINVDVTAYHSGFHGDTSATFFVGDVDDEGRRLVEVTRECLLRAIDICGPGVPLNMIGKTIAILAKKEGYAVSRNFCGHGIGRRFHELPMIYHHYNDDPGTMEAGMTFTIEPLLMQGSGLELKWGDNWTVASKDGGRSAQFEHTVLITEDGATVMTTV